MQLTIKKEGSLLDAMLEAFGSASRTTVKQRIAHGNVRVNGRMETNPGRALKPGDTVEYLKQAVTQHKVAPPFPVLYEDASLLVAVKPAGLLSVGERGLGGTSFYQQMLAWVKETSKGKERLFVVHRLDKETSGLILLAKNERAHRWLQDQFRLRKIQKVYLALVDGHPPTPSGRIEAPIGRDPKARKEYTERLRQLAQVMGL